MFESAEVGHKVSKKVYEEEVPALREALLEAQFELVEQGKHAIVIVVAGVDGAGKGDTVNLLHAWLDARHMRTHGMGAPTDEEKARPKLFRFWRLLPPKGDIGVFMGSWYTEPIIQRAYGQIGDAKMALALEKVRRFEKVLTDEGVILIKLWFHLSKEEQRARLKRLESDKRTRWRVTKTDWKHFKLYDRFRKISERALRPTSTDNAPWLVVSGNDARYRHLTVGRALLGALRRATQRGSGELPPPALPPALPPVDGRNVLNTLDLSQSLSKKSYKRDLEKYQGKLALLTRDERFKDRSLVLVFEGADAAGKGGAIRRVTAALDARLYHVVPIAAPTDEEKAQPYLWRFWRHIPTRGKAVVFDRSWYGRVLVERVEGFAPVADWTRAYSEINDFEEQLVESGAVVIKFWLQIDPEEQLARFKAREKTGFKRHKITDEDWRNREKWGDYQLAVNDMIERTSTDIAPWILVEANNKPFARVKVLKAVCEELEKRL